MHRQLAHLCIVNTHYNDIHHYYNDIHYFNNPNISLIRPPSGPELFGLVRVYCSKGYAKSPEFLPALGLIVFREKSVATNLR